MYRSQTTSDRHAPSGGALDYASILRAYDVVREVTVDTPLQRNPILSDRYNCNVFLKREDLQRVRSFKLRGAYNFLRHIPAEQLERGVVCASAGNHAQGVAYSCRHLNVRGTIFMPTTTPRQKVNQVARFGGDFVTIQLMGDTFDDAFAAAMDYCTREQLTFVHPFDDPLIAAGQGTIAIEIVRDMAELGETADYVFTAIGGGGLASGIGTYLRQASPVTRLIGAEPAGAPSMKRSLEAKQVVVLDEIDKFVDGAAVKQVGQLTFEVCKTALHDVVVVPEGKICSTILELYNENAIVAEPAGAMPIAALDEYRDQIIGKNVVCVLSGGNNDIDRMQEIKERSLIYEGLMHYFIIHFPQRAGALREFIDLVVGPDDDITRFEYTKKNNKENGPALVGIELKQRDDYGPLIARMEKYGIQYSEINKDPSLFQLLI
ncbi:threonine ammonia-lyase IlvA [Alicyclobacillus cycloheptanicus]|jgi:threonine dehydratase|uniref:L-threonine dehydratase n=1 Tax=Alicyclobacillus cycloheptanicus TaxID=1457 RepID=A0ABT9XFP3_9BACL|nr:threonine ammonia-lyase IlvA [Alicyclobacillus cycloheptanicus]MDQ0189118.1 threonine dehydratase [Alicyclobacillus cycloheptanicus]WDM00248.1 threonine ammonia-lyase IlvA [Alicyclobacillus cycloheptanicus]